MNLYIYIRPDSMICGSETAPPEIVHFEDPKETKERHQRNSQRWKDSCLPFEDQKRATKTILTHVLKDTPVADSQKKWIIDGPLFIFQGKRDDQLLDEEQKIKQTWLITRNGLLKPDTILEVDLPQWVMSWKI